MEALKVMPLTIYGLVFAVGIPGNILVILIYGRKSPVICVQALILAQAISDFLGATATFSRQVYKYCVTADQTDTLFYRILNFSANSVTLLSLLLIAALVTDRYKYVKHFRRYSVKNTKETVSVIVLLCLLGLFIAISLELAKPYQAVFRVLSAVAGMGAIGIVLLTCIRSLQILYVFRSRQVITPKPVLELNSASHFPRLSSWQAEKAHNCVDVPSVRAVNGEAHCSYEPHPSASSPKPMLTSSSSSSNTSIEPLPSAEFRMNVAADVNPKIELPGQVVSCSGDHLAEYPTSGSGINIDAGKLEGTPLPTASTLTQYSAAAEPQVQMMCDRSQCPMLTHVTKMLLTASFFFIRTYIPNAIVFVLWSSYVKPIQDSQPGLFLFFGFVNNLYCFNYAINPVIYLMNPTFRHDLFRLFRCV